jgi:hypothetical protein
MKQLKPGETPFSTSNAILAYCLHLAGVPWENDRHPVRVLYSAPILNKFTNGSGEPFYKGWELEKAAAHAHKTKRRGHVEYCFQNTPRLGKLIKAYKAQCDDLEIKDGFLHQVVRDLASHISEMEPDIAMVRLACIFLQKRMEFMEIWEHQIPLVMIPNQGRVRHSREVIDTKYGAREANVITSPGMKIMSLNASDKTRKELGV